MTGSGEEINDRFRITSIMIKMRVIFSSTEVDSKIFFGKSFIHFKKGLQNVEMSKIRVTIHQHQTITGHHCMMINIFQNTYLYGYDIAFT